jgi:glucose/arabinose dehydrogenase
MRDGSLVVTDPEGGLVTRFAADGTELRAYTVRGAASPAAKPVGVAVGADGTIWVADVEGGSLLRVVPGE